MSSVSSIVGIAGLIMAAGLLAILTFVVHPDMTPGRLFQAYWPVWLVVAGCTVLAVAAPDMP